MTAKTNGAEFKAYYNDKNAWPEGWCHDDVIITIDGVEDDGSTDLSAVCDDAAVNIKGGGVYRNDDSQLQISMETHFKRWLKAQAVDRVVVEVNKASKEEFLEAIKRAGAMVVK